MKRKCFLDLPMLPPRVCIAGEAFYIFLKNFPKIKERMLYSIHMNKSLFWREDI